MFQWRDDHLRTEERYRALREITYEAVMEEYPEITAKDISIRDAFTADSWKHIDGDTARTRRGSWDWAREYPYYKKKPNRFEISLWRGGVLGALSYGQTSKSGTRVRMNLIESIPLRPTPLGMRALPVLSYAAAAFAHLVGADELWVLDPDPSLEGLYMQEGFGSRTYYHGKRVGQRIVL
ncbi:hypothetical protein [Microbulbifer rhizosphaerae]|uniref:N-acetyltransferase domain-containing protein n=1 Tax=Microbulbifer rhizosphaerae TaxID=1562603 RepID=A0A7W4W9X7_9GAMM|nr:hypothetical protein [Microbulbifer rhizosphaerae]MBB3059721.1 hypothetical protein [Microbulbifer rhizosphaerae]